MAVDSELLADAGRMVGRDAECQSLRGAVDATAGGASTLVELQGEAGIGKTRLLGYVAELAARRGLTVLRGRASSIERDLPYGLWIDAIGAWPTDQALAGDAAPLRHHLHRELRGLMAAEAGPRGLVVLLDDVHWADSASLDLLRSVIDRGLAVPTLLVAAHRPNHPGSQVRLREWRGTIDRRLTVELGPLSADDLGAMFPAAVAAHDRQELTRACGGNPLFLTAALRTIDAAAPDPATIAAAGAVRSVLSSELEPLSAQARALLDAAAVIGDPFHADVALDLAGLPPGSHAVVDELLGADLVRAGHGAGVYRFRHSLVHAHLYDATPAAWRADAHRRLVQALTARGAHPAVLAPHVERSAAPGDTAAIAVLAEAGRSARGRAPASAAHWLATALALVPDARRAELDDLILAYDAAYALAVAGRVEEAHAIVVDLLTRVAADHVAWPVITVGTATLERMLGRTAQARTRLEAALAAGGPEPTSQRVAFLVELATLELADGRREALAQHAAGAVAAATAVGDPVLTVGATAVGAFAACLGGDGAVATDAVGELARQLQALPPAAASHAARSFGLLGEAAALVHRPGLALELIAGVLPGMPLGATPLVAVELLSSHAVLLTQAGRVAEAGRVADSALEEARLGGSDRALLAALLAVSTAEELGGDAGAAVVAAEQALTYAHRTGATHAQGVAGQTLARARLAAGDPRGAVRAIDDTHGGDAALSALPPMLRAESLSLLARATAQLDDPVDAGAGSDSDSGSGSAADWAAASHAAAESDGLDGSWAFAWLASAEVALAGGDALAAVADAGDAASAAARAGLRSLAARARLVQGQALAAADQRDEAAAVLREIEAELTRAGADRLAAEAVRVLRGIGRRVNRTGREGVTPGMGRLSARQLQVAELAAAGRSNRQIADELFVSVKTVETHLSAAFATLGVSSRHALGAALTLAGGAGAAPPRQPADLPSRA